MKRIDRETVQRVLDAADIVEVVSDFVTLKRRGANYIGLCPFHNERTPSFSVSKAKGICKCFSCGKGGSPVNFIMEHEQMSFNEAIRYLAKKYHIEIKERELTTEEQQQESERESMLTVNDFALGHFTSNLHNTADGRDIGLSYFRERGINDQMISRFKLGYALDKSDALYRDAIGKGYSEKFLFDTGLCARSERGTVYDKFKGRVIYPLFSVSGRVIAFGGRTLRSDKAVAKYINSPQSLIYNKSRELYGLYQAKSAIAKLDKCILVEGYMDVISMHQVGIENVVASSGTSLTEGQIRLIHRFTSNVTVIYDSDAAGIKASLRGIDMLLAEGMNIKVLLLPEGDDPDSYAQSHSSTEVEKYIAEHETDFIRFKTRILLDDAKGDPIARAKVINNIINSIAVIPDAVLRSEYIRECSRMLDIAEDTLVLQLKKVMAENLEKRNATASQDREKEKQDDSTISTETRQPEERGVPEKSASDKMRKYEKELIKYVVRYGMASMDSNDVEGIKVLDYITEELSNDSISLTVPVMKRILDVAIKISQSRWPAEKESHEKTLIEQFNRSLEAGREEIRKEALDLADIEARERRLTQECTDVYMAAIDDFAVKYLQDILVSYPEDDIRNVATMLAIDQYTLSKVHTRYAHIETERERLQDLVSRAVFELKLGILNEQIAQIQGEIRLHASEPIVAELLGKQKMLYEIRSELSKFLGERIVTPR